jgi:hypothetical protein
MRALKAKRLVKVEKIRSPRHEFGYLHVLTPWGISERAALADHLRRRKIAEYERLQETSRRFY